MSKENKAIIEMILCASLWSIAGIFMKLLPWNGFAVASLRSFFAGLTFVVYMFITKKKLVINKKTVLSGIMTGCVYICFSCANKLTTSANAIVLQFTSPIFVVLISAIVYKTKISRLDLLTVILTLFGISLFFLDQLGAGGILGNIVAIMAGLFMAGMFVAVGASEGDERFSTILVGQMFTFLVCFPFVVATRPVINGMTLTAIIILGVFQLGISYVLYVRSTQYCPPLACCLISVIEPLLNPVWVAIFDGEMPGKFAFIGGIIVIATVTAWCILSRKQDAVSKET